jgi:phosphoglycolate phosphatase-like HAD superfamily hydrolase
MPGDLPDTAQATELAADERPPAAVFDIDGVLADVRHRLRHVERRPKDWAAFFAAMDDDGPLEMGVALAHDQAAQGHAIVYLTGRNESHRALTEAWLRRHGLPEGRLVMRPDYDRRPARLLKPDAVRRLARRCRIVAVVDDDAAVVAVLRGAGWPVLHATWMTAQDEQQQALFDVQEVEGRS